MSSLLVGISLVVVAIVLFTVVRRALRAPKEPAWASEFWLANCHIPLVVVLLVFGIAYLVQGVVRYVH